jgi:two-component system chemotaxis sensor kinase CheA
VNLDQKKYRELFVEEAKEQLENLNQALLSIESNGEDPELVNEAFRLVHTIKGAAKILGIDSIGELAHVTEDILDNVKQNKISLSQDMIDTLFESTDIMTKMIDELTEYDNVTSDCTEFIEQLKEFIKSNDIARQKNTDAAIQKISLDSKQKETFHQAQKDGLNIYLLTLKLEEDCKLKEGRIFQVLRELKSIGDIITSKPDKGQVTEDTNNVAILLTTKNNVEDAKNKASGVSKIEEVIGQPINSLEELNSINKLSGKISDKKTLGSSSDTVRVKSKYLDNLLNLVGELMISEIRIKQLAEDINHKDLKQFLKNNDRLISEVQDHILRMRMVPIDHILKRFPRMIRDMSKEMDKEIDFKMEGNDIEIDRSLLDDVGDAIMHLLRNSIDHGLETKEDRKASNKSQIGSLILRTHREQSNVVIEVVDDGHGIDPDKIVAAAVSKGLISQDKVSALDEKEKLELAFLPGLTTAEEVSDVSGRGVGLDVVNEKIKRLGGSINAQQRYESIG